MLKLSLSIEEYLQIDDNVRIAFLGGTPSHLRILVDAPPEVNILRGKVIAKKQGDKADLPTFHAEKKTGSSRIYSNKDQKSAYKLAMKQKDKEKADALRGNIPEYEWNSQRAEGSSKKK